MQILSLMADNFKRLKAVQITPAGDLVMVTGRNAQGKQQPISEPVLTPFGWRPIGEIQIGDFVIGRNGQPTRVKAIHPQTERRTFRLTVMDGGTTRCGPDHLWTVYTWRYSRARKVGEWVERTLTTRGIMDGVLWRKAGSRKWALPNLDVVQYPDQGINLPVDPYTLGAILGDGHIELTGYASIVSADPEILNRLQLRSAWRGERNGIITLGSGEWSRPLTHLGLAGKLSFEKFIPSIYLTANEHDRRQLLAGLLDTDGTTPSNWAEYSTSSEKLALDIADLARGLGYLVNITNQTKKYNYNGTKKEGRLSYKVRIKRGPCPFLLSRKIKRWTPALRDEAHRFISKIEEVEEEQSVCIEVEAADGLYVTNDYLVTHNSSVLDAISAALSGAGACPADPIRHGEQSAQIRLDLGEVVVTRKFTAGGSTLTLTNAEGAKFGSPQKMLDSLLGALTFDPLEFTRMKPREQFDQLRAVAKVELDLDRLQQLNDGDFARRTDLTREAKAARAQLEGLRVPPAEIPEPRDVAQLVHQVQEAFQARMTAQRERDERRRIQNAVDAKRAEIEVLRQKAMALQAEVKALLPQLEAALATPEPTDYDAAIETINDQIRTAQTHNLEVQQHQLAATRRAELETLAVTKETAAQGLTEAMAARQTAKEQALAAAKFPVPGLSLGDGQVLFNGVPLAQASSAEQLRISTALAMAANPKVKVVLVREGSLLDEDGLRLVAEMATAKGYQVWVEKVDSSRGIGVVIEDGQVIADNQEEEGMEVPA